MPTGDLQQPYETILDWERSKARTNVFQQHGVLPGYGTAGDSFDPVLKIKVDTNVKPDGVIEQIVTGIGDSIQRYVMSTRDVQVKQALIDLGWTPPA